MVRTCCWPLPIVLCFHRMLEEFDMELKLQQNFYDLFQERRHKKEDAILLHNIKAFNAKVRELLDPHFLSVSPVSLL